MNLHADGMVGEGPSLTLAIPLEKASIIAPRLCQMIRNRDWQNGKTLEWAGRDKASWQRLTYSFTSLHSGASEADISLYPKKGPRSLLLDILDKSRAGESGRGTRSQVFVISNCRYEQDF